MKRIYLTHSGLMHADEIAGYVVAKVAGVVSGFQRVDIKTAAEFVAANPDVYLVADILREYAPDRWRYDHHQQNQNTPELYRPNGIPYATAGLLWRALGENFFLDLIRERRGDWFAENVFSRVDKVLFEQLDANDAAPDWYAEGHAAGHDVRVTTISHILSSFNADDIKDNTAQYFAFLDAANWFEKILKRTISDAVQYVENLEQFEEIATYDAETQTIHLPKQMQGWQEMAAEIYSDALYIFGPSAFPDKDNPFSLLAVPVQPGRRELKKPIERPDGWVKFIHAGKFIAAVASWGEAKTLIEKQ